MTHICVGTNTNIGSDNSLSPGRRQAIIWTNAGILLNGPLATNISEILIEILAFSFTKMRLKVSSSKWRPFCLGLNVLMHHSNTEAIVANHAERYTKPPVLCSYDIHRLTFPLVASNIDTVSRDLSRLRPIQQHGNPMFPCWGAKFRAHISDG